MPAKRPDPPPPVNLLMMSGDVALAQGRQNVFYDMLRHFSRHWTRIDILCPGAPGSAPRTVHGNVHVHPSRRPKALQGRDAFAHARSLMRDRGYDLIVSHDYVPFFNGVTAWRLSRRSGVPFVSEIHHVAGHPRAATARDVVDRALTEIYVRWVWRRAAAIRAVNRVEVPELLRRWGVPDDKILVLPSVYLDLDVFRPMPQEEKRFDVLFVGRFAPNKRISTIVDAFAKARNSDPSARLALLGDGPLRADVERQVRELALGEHVTIIPQVGGAADVAALYNRARVVVCASTGEGGPRVAVEAMACGTPVVSTPVGLARELIQHGETGLLFEWGADELASHLVRLLGDENLRAQLGEAGRRAVTEFRAADLIERLASSYRALARRATAERVTSHDTARH